MYFPNRGQPCTCGGVAAQDEQPSPCLRAGSANRGTVHLLKPFKHCKMLPIVLSLSQEHHIHRIVLVRSAPGMIQLQYPPHQSRRQLSGFLPIPPRRSSLLWSLLLPLPPWKVRFKPGLDLSLTVSPRVEVSRTWMRTHVLRQKAVMRLSRRALLGRCHLLLMVAGIRTTGSQGLIALRVS